ncbi:DUF418 domain-containing protein [Nesterenkonia flava]|uniref:DUF418 domain-containing protein n=1 Tax=Nesterenkonia flava TaxID=469799 RepID=A0ABU1FSZ4_9MICC|nr:DUF418 domain-containing protein [Nesterenkonia flava]MDR5711781.1 DUF418 domain-containing protein [Nesterenkonia flava]
MHKPPEPPGPTTSAHGGAPGASRIVEVDALRALALLGILAVNIWYFAFPATLAAGTRPAAGESGADQAALFVSTVVFEGKSYVVFSLLFGLSLVLSGTLDDPGRRERIPGDREREDHVRRRAYRRFSALLVLGLLHGLLLFTGDILLAYGLLGFLLWSMRHLDARAALGWAAGLYAGVCGLLLAVGALAAAVPEAWETTAETGASASAAATASYTESLVSYLGYQLEVYPTVQPVLLLVQGPVALAAFLLGMVVGRARLIPRLISGEIPVARLAVAGTLALLTGLAGSVSAAWLTWGLPGDSPPGTGLEGLATALVLTAGPVQSAGLAVLILLLARTRTLRLVLRSLAPAGRMTLSNYLGQSLVLVLIFAAPGLGLAGTLRPAEVGVVVLLLWGTQLVASALWMRRFRRGPFEAALHAWVAR